MCDVCGTCVCVVRRSVGRLCVRSVNERCCTKEESVRRMACLLVVCVCCRVVSVCMVCACDLCAPMGTRLNNT